MVYKYLMVIYKDPIRQVQDFDKLVDLDIPVICMDSDDRFMIPFPKLQDFVLNLYLAKKTGKSFVVSNKIKELDFLITDRKGRKISDITETQKDNLRLGIDSTFKELEKLKYIYDGSSVKIISKARPIFSYTFDELEIFYGNLKGFIGPFEDIFRKYLFDHVPFFASFTADLISKGYISIETETLEYLRSLLADRWRILLL